ncbi:recombination regulator RecX [Cytobacillus sp. S13-E01]|uniref:recombination regulator RecX n=1 Tax=Cytobacillus sp. S13-E01 TaxID=3031326 RepID=UPI0023D8071C|nr:recombination regulator RecX [Cytobacillus sp. S13-E01]MDF0725914.1 recombination regulator RecX [Cytobacillus sp. S13-E01]
MAYITKVTTQQKNTERYNVFLDYGKGEEYAFSVDQDVLVKFQLKKGKELDELDISEIQFDDEIKKAYSLALTFLSYRMRSEKEIVAYLKKKEVAEPIIPNIINKLVTNNYVNDKEFANAYVKTQKNTTTKGPGVIKQELLEKGINHSTIEASLEEYGQASQVESAVKLAEKMLRQSTKISKRQLKQKIEEMLMRKGYPRVIIQIALEEIVSNEPETEAEAEVDEEWEALEYQGRKAHNRFNNYNGREYEQKMKQALFRKGFSLDLISKYIEKVREEE